LTDGDRTFLAKLAASADGFVAISKTGSKAESSVNFTAAAGRRMADTTTCTSPLITHEITFELGDSVATDSFPGSSRVIIDDTTTTFDLTTGADLTCDPGASMNGTKEVFREAMQEGTLLVTSMSGTTYSRITGDLLNIQSAADLAKISFDLTAYMKGTVTYTNGFALLLETAYIHASGKFSDTAFGIGEAYYHVKFSGYPYSSGMRYNAATDALEGDIVRDSSRIGTMKVFKDDRMEVKDLDGNAISP